MFLGLVPRSFGVTVAVQVAALPLLFARIQFVKVSFASGDENAIVPPGLDAVPLAPLSVTVTVIVLD
jgi:multidrug efflux pump subunit AcrA (membrane-fusion protein)